MANLSELIQYEAGIYQLETADPVLGGPDGIDNLQAKQLANRTAYLKQQVDALEAGTGAGGLVPPGIATKDYVAGELDKRDAKQSARAATTGAVALNGAQNVDGIALQVGDRVLVKNQADATQNGIYVVAAGAWARATDADQNVDVTAGMVVEVEEGALQAASIWKLTTPNPINLGASLLSFADITTGYAPLNSPNFSGAPTAPTPAQFDASTKLATMAAVQRALGNFRGGVQFAVGANVNLAAADAGQVIQMQGGTLNLPASAGLTPGVAFAIWSSAAATVNANGADRIYGSGPAASISLGQGDFVLLAYQGAGAWAVMGGSAALGNTAAFAVLKGQSGYQRLPGGFLVQWGPFSVNPGSSPTVINFPLAFPSGCAQIVASDTGGASYAYAAAPLSTAQFNAWARQYDGNYIGGVGRFIAVGY